MSNPQHNNSEKPLDERELSILNACYTLLLQKYKEEQSKIEIPPEVLQSREEHDHDKRKQ